MTARLKVDLYTEFAFKRDLKLNRDIYPLILLSTDRRDVSLKGLDPGNKVGVAELSIHMNGLLPLSWHCCGSGHCHDETKHSAFANLV